MTDSELIEDVARRVMRWPVYRRSAHRPGQRPLPHAWRQAVAPHGSRLIVYEGNKVNRHWDPLASDPDAADVAEAMEMRGTPLPPWESADEGRRALCLASLATLDAEAAEPQEPLPETPTDEEL